MKIYSCEHYNPKILEIYLHNDLLFEYLKILDLKTLENAKRLIECDDILGDRIVILKALELEIKTRYAQEEKIQKYSSYSSNSPEVRHSKKVLKYFLFINRLTDYLQTLTDEELERCYDLGADDIFDDECNILDSVRLEQEYRASDRALKSQK